MRKSRSFQGSRRLKASFLVASIVGALTVGPTPPASAAQGDVTTLAGQSIAGFCDTAPVSPLCVPGQPKLDAPYGITVGSDGTVYISDSGLPVTGDVHNQAIRKVSPAGAVRTMAGAGDNYGFRDGVGTFEQIAINQTTDPSFIGARFNTPIGVVADAAGTVYVADYNNHRIRKVTTAAPASGQTYGAVNVTTVAGAAEGFANGTGTAALFKNPAGVAIGPDGFLYVGDFNNDRIRKVDLATGGVTTFAGGARGATNGPRAAATFSGPSDLEFDAAGNLYVVDGLNYLIRKIATDGTVSTFAGSGNPAEFEPNSLAVAADGTVYVSDTSKNRIIKINPNGSAGVFAGSTAGFADGNSLSAQFNAPRGLAIDPTGTILYVADSSNFRIRKVTLNGALPAQAPLVSVAPQRPLDSRNTTRDPSVTNATWAVNVGSLVPIGAKAAALNVTITNTTTAGVVTVWPCGEPQPATSNLNYVAGLTIANAVLSKIGTNGTICIAATSLIDVIVDVNGYVPATSGINPVTPFRLADTRPGAANGTYDGNDPELLLSPTGEPFKLQVAGRSGIPVGTDSVVLNMTVTETTAPGHITVWPCDAAKPNSSNLNFVAGQTVPNLVIAKVATTGLDAGKVCVQPTGGSTRLVVDVQATIPGGTSLASLTPARLLETRPGYATVDGQFNNVGIVAPGTPVELTVIGRAGVPAGAQTVVLNVTATGPTGAGHVSVYPCGAVVADVSSLNYTAGRTVPNLVVAKIGAGGKVCLKTTGASAYVLADVMAYN